MDYSSGPTGLRVGAALLLSLVLALSGIAAEAAQTTRPRRAPAAAPASKPAVKPAPPKDDVGRFLAWVTGHFSNDAQAPLKGISPGGSDKQAQDRVHVRVRQVPVPALEGTVLLVQWNRDRADGPMARLRLWAVSAGGADRIATLKIYGLRDTETFVDAIDSPEILQTVAIDDLFVPADSCDLPITRTADGFLATTLPACPSAVAMPQTLTRFQVRLKATAGGFTYSETGYRDPDFATAFALPKTGSYEFERVQ